MMMMDGEYLNDLDRMTDFVTRIENDLTKLKEIIDLRKNKISTISLQAGGAATGDDASCLKTRPVPTSASVNDSNSNNKSSKIGAATGPITRLKRNSSKPKIDEITPAKEVSTSTVLQAAGGDGDANCLKTRPVTVPISINDNKSSKTVAAAETGPITRLKRNSSKSKVDESIAKANCTAPADIVGPNNSKIKLKEIAAKVPPQTEIVPQTSLPASSLLDIQPIDFPPTISIVELPKTPPFTDPNNDSNGPFDFLADFDFDSFIAATPTEMCVDSTVEAVKGASYYLLKDAENTAIQLADYINQQRQGELTIENILDQVWTTKLPEQFQLEDGELPEEKEVKTDPRSSTSTNNDNISRNSTASTSTKNHTQEKLTRRKSQQVLPSNVDNQQLTLHKDSRSRLSKDKEIKTVPPSTITINENISICSSSTKNLVQEKLTLTRRRSQQVLPSNVDNQQITLHKDSRTRLPRDKEIKTVPASTFSSNDNISRNITASSTRNLENEKLNKRSQPQHQQVSSSNVGNQNQLVLHKDNRSKWEALGRRKIEPKIPYSSLSTTPTSEKYQTPRKSQRYNSNIDSPIKMTPIKIKITPKKSPRKRKNTPKKKPQDPLKNLRSTRRSLFDLSTSSPETEKKEEQEKKPSSKPVLKQPSETLVEKKSNQDQTRPQKPIIETKTETEKQAKIPEKVIVPESSEIVIPPPKKRTPETRAEKKSKKRDQRRPQKPIIETKKKTIIPEKEKVIVPEAEVVIPPSKKRQLETRDEKKSKKSDHHKSQKQLMIETKTEEQVKIPEKVIVPEPEIEVVIPLPKTRSQEALVEKKSKNNQRQPQKPIIETKTKTEKQTKIPEKVPEIEFVLPPPNKKPKLSFSSTETVIVPEPDNEVILSPPSSSKPKPKLSLSAYETVLHINPKPIFEPLQRAKIESTPPKKNALLNFFKFN